MLFKIRRKKERPESLKVALKKQAILILKCLIVTTFPLPFVFIALMFWWRVFWGSRLVMSEKVEGIMVAAAIPTLGILYSLLTAVILSSVWKEYKTIRISVKQGDKDLFMLYRDENVSLLVHTLIFVCSLFLLLGFMIIKYPNPESGFYIVGGVSYFLALFFFVIVEIDNPCSGVWFIHDIEEDWLKEDADEYLKRLRQQNGRRHGKFIREAQD